MFLVVPITFILYLTGAFILSLSEIKNFLSNGKNFIKLGNYSLEYKVAEYSIGDGFLHLG